MLSSATLALPKFQSANPEFFGDSGFSMKILRVRYAIYDITVSAVSIPCLESLKVSYFTILHPANQFWTGQVKTGAKTGGGEEKVLQEIHITTRRGRNYIRHLFRTAVTWRNTNLFKAFVSLRYKALNPFWTRVPIVENHHKFHSHFHENSSSL